MNVTTAVHTMAGVEVGAISQRRLSVLSKRLLEVHLGAGGGGGACFASAVWADGDVGARGEVLQLIRRLAKLLTAVLESSRLDEAPWLEREPPPCCPQGKRELL